MNNCIKLFFIFLSFLITLSVNTLRVQTCNAIVPYNTQEIINSISIEKSGIKPGDTKNAIVASNSTNHELIPISERKDTFNNNTIFKFHSQYKLFQRFFYSKYNQIYISNSQKISPYLKNEICTRAP